MYLFRILPLCVLLLTLAGCQRSGEPRKKKDPAIATAFTGPVSLNLRAEVNPQSKNVATSAHGEKLEVLQVRRRFVRVRTPGGQEGWTEVRNLLGPEQMEALDVLAKKISKLPSQGEATVYTALNIHTEPNRTSTSFYRLTEGVKVAVVGHQLVPRTAQPQAPTFQIAKPPARPRKKKEKKGPTVAPPPKPAAPGLPSNWVELSKTQLPQPTPEVLIAQQAKPEKKIPLEDWSLVRTKDGRAGWALTRNLVMAIPDEVAQYSEGARITSYFALGDVVDGDETKHHWLWTTMREGSQEPYDFDSFRVFIYMARRHRYETAYIERRVEGFYPVMVTTGTTTRFALIVRGDDGNLVRRTYQLDGYALRKVGQEPYEMKSGTPGATLAGEVPDVDAPNDIAEDAAAGSADENGKPSLLDRAKSWWNKK